MIEGWPAGLRLARLSLWAPADLAAAIAAVGISHSSMRDYLFSEIFADLPEGRHEWLLKIAILDRFCLPLCVTLCDRIEGDEDTAAGQAFVAWLQATNLFLVPLDDQGLWFRFHHLFLHLLRYQQQARYNSACLSVLHGRVAAWFAEQVWWRKRCAMPWPRVTWIKRLAIIVRRGGSCSTRRTGRGCSAGSISSGRVRRADA